MDGLNPQQASHRQRSWQRAACDSGVTYESGCENTVKYHRRCSIVLCAVYWRIKWLVD